MTWRDEYVREMHQLQSARDTKDLRAQLEAVTKERDELRDEIKAVRGQLCRCLDRLDAAQRKAGDVVDVIPESEHDACITKDCLRGDAAGGPQ